MSHVRCPMCGKDSAISRFDPQTLDRDIYIRQVVKLPQGEGFTYEPDISVLGDEELTPLIKDRSIDLIRLFLETGNLTEDELMEELKIGVPTPGTHEVVPYKVYQKQLRLENNMLIKKVSELEGQLTVNSLFTVSSTEHEELKTRYEKLLKKHATNKKIEDILRYLHETLPSRLRLLNGEWVLVIEEWDESVFKYLSKEMYRLTPQERKELEGRIVTVNEEINFIFNYFKTEPTITGQAELFYKKPGRLYYLLYGLPHPDPVINKELETIRETVGNWKNINH